MNNKIELTENNIIDTLPTAKAGGFYTARNASLPACLTSIVAIGVCAQTPLATRY